MPKDKSNRYICQKAREYSGRPYPSSDSQNGSLRDKSLGEDARALSTDWKSVICPVCMEIPHNALLLQCSSYDKGCRPFLCDTSYRHSNCFDQYVKAHLALRKIGNGLRGSEATSSGDVLGGPTLQSTRQEASMQHNSSELAAGRESLQRRRVDAPRVSKGDVLGLTCPLCRGYVKGYEVVKKARDMLNRKARVCAREACTFSGSYQELRVHARRDHPTVRPAETDPVRQRSWSRMEQRWELGDVLSAIQDSMPPVTFSGDYAIDGEDVSIDNIERTLLSEDSDLLNLFLSFQMFGGSVHSFFGGGNSRPFRGVLRGRQRPGSSRQGLWGEILQQGQTTESIDDFAMDVFENEDHLERVNYYLH